VAEHAASPLTVQRAVKRLVLEGLVETRPGSGNFVARQRAIRQADYSWQTTALGEARSDRTVMGTTMATAPAGTIALHGGYPGEDLLPFRLVRTALVRASRGASAMARGAASGLPELRSWFASEIPSLGSVAPVTADDVLITPGGQSAMSSVFRALAVHGDSVVMESPTYWGAMAAARQAGLRIVPVARGSHSTLAEALDVAFAASGARLFYAQPHFANPTGVVWSAGERRDILSVIRARGVYLVEDDWAHDFSIDTDVTPLMAEDTDGHVIFIRSLTKSLSPSLRVGAVIARGPALARIQADRMVDDLYVSGVLQTAAIDVLTDPGWRSHLVRLRGSLRERRDELARQVVGHLGADALTLLPKGGMNLWVRLDDGTDVTALAARSREAGVMFAPGEDWFPTEPTGAFLRLNYSGDRPERFGEAVETIARLLP